jgi:pimeloyl-ACP methyl ester carboxylesterase
MPTAKVGDLTIYYEVKGEGKPIVLHHGLAGSVEQWHAATQTLLDLGYRVIAFDQRGHGRTSDGTKPFTLPQLKEDMRGLMDHLGVQRATLLGHSMGGRTVLLFALDHPDRVDRLILNGAGGSAPGGDLRAAFDLFAEVARKQGMEAVWALDKYQARLPRLLKESPGLAAPFKAGFLKNRPEGYAGAINAIVTMPDLAARLGEIRCPTLALAGAEDPAAPFVDAVCAKAPTATKAIIPGAGHFPHLETPDLFNAALRTFLES